MPSRRSAKRSYGAFLSDDELLDAFIREGKHGVKLGPLVGSAFRSRLQLDPAAILYDDAVQVGRGLEVLCVVESRLRVPPGERQAAVGRVGRAGAARAAPRAFTGVA